MYLEIVWDKKRCTIVSTDFLFRLIISVTCPEAQMRLSAMIFSIRLHRFNHDAVQGICIFLQPRSPLPAQVYRLADDLSWGRTVSSVRCDIVGY